MAQEPKNPQPETKQSRLERRAKRKEERDKTIAMQRSQFHKRQRNKRIVTYSFIAIVIIAIAYGIYVSVRPDVTASAHDALAQCLTKKGAVMYGTDWCPHCQAQKREFGDSFRYVTFINCDVNADACNAANVVGYPTWVFPDGQRTEGEQALEKLADLSGCTAP